MPSRPMIEYEEDDLRELIREDIKRRYGWSCPDVDVSPDLGHDHRWFAVLPDAFAAHATEREKE